MKTAKIFHNRDAQSDADGWIQNHPNYEIIDVKVTPGKDFRGFFSGEFYYPTVVVLYRKADEA